MAQLKRSEIITLARKWAGRKAQAVDLVDEFDFVVQDMSKRYPLLRDEATGNLTADQNYITLPTDYRSQDLFVYNGYPTALKIGDNWLWFIKNPTDFKEYDDTEYGTPTLYTVMEDPATKKIYFYPKLETLTPAYKFLHYAIHAKSADDDTLHDYGENWDHVVANGVAWRAGIILKEKDIEERYLAYYLTELQKMHGLVKPARYRRVAYHHF